MAKKMTTNQLIQAIYRKSTGELDETVTADTEDGMTILSIINEQIDYYYNAVDQLGQRCIWFRNIDPEYVLGTANGVDTIYYIDWNEVQALPAGLYTTVKVGEVPYSLVPFDQLYSSPNPDKKRCAISSEGLVFYEAPVAGDILFPCIPVGKWLEGDETDVEAVSGVHNLLWLTFASAAEYVRTDVVRGSQYPNVLAQANDIFTRMIADNESRTQQLGYSVGSDTISDW